MRCAVKEIRVAGRNTQGVRIKKLSGEEKVVSVIKIDNNIELVSEALRKKPMALFRHRDAVAVFENEEDIKSMIPNMEKLKKLDYASVIITAPGRDVDFVSRNFAPKLGIPEDPVTGSAHCELIPYWSRVLNKK